MDTEVQSTAPHENGSKIEQISSEPSNGETVSNGNDSKSSPKHHTLRQTRSRSRTPQKKKSKKTDEDTNKNVESTDDNVNGHQTRKTRSSDSNKQELNEIVEEVEEASSKIENVSEEPPKEESDNQEVTIVSEEVQIETETVVIESEVIIENTDSVKPVEVIEMDPLILPPDEQDPELQFDENSDMDSVRGSPIQTRCKTRRSQTRNIPSPKTPKSTTDSESEKIFTEPTLTESENLTDTFDEDVSTRAEIGSDTTRLEFMENNSSIQSEESNYVSNYNDESYRESIRRVTARRTIRPLNDSYRQRALRNCLNKTDLNVSYPNYDSVDRHIGVKRKRSPTPEDRKRFKEENSSFVSYLSSPLSNFKRRFSTDFGSSSPKLTGYKDSTNDIHEGELHQEVDSEDFEKKNRCSVM